MKTGRAALAPSLYQSPPLARLVVGGLPNLDEQHIVSFIGAALENKLRPIVRLHIDGKKLRGRMGNNDEILTNFNLKLRGWSLPDRL